jgi:hypothetical protein
VSCSTFFIRGSRTSRGPSGLCYSYRSQSLRFFRRYLEGLDITSFSPRHLTTQHWDFSSGSKEHMRNIRKPFLLQDDALVLSLSKTTQKGSISSRNATHRVNVVHVPGQCLRASRERLNACLKYMALSALKAVHHRRS